MSICGKLKLTRKDLNTSPEIFTCDENVHYAMLIRWENNKPL